MIESIEIKQYKVVFADDVQGYLDDGWFVYGNPIASSHFIYQAIIKETKL